MRLILIRHGESVDNVAGVYAGSRDSTLTSHGVVQAQCTAEHLAGKMAVHYVFSSNLQRAVRTAQAIVEEQKRVHQFDGELVQLASLREKDYGSLEGVRLDSPLRRRPDDSETNKSMRSRVEEFVNQHLVPLLGVETPKQTFTCAVVAHGTILNVLWHYLIDRTKQSRSNLLSASTHAARNPELPRGAVFWWNAGITDYRMRVMALHRPHHRMTFG
ncbi:hypothetical protein ESCO_003365 [Escovopsis weberi]|uniref:Phosphatase n=1 Tax=Escovopsis weberi TaxID=150374 RepID=A0A0M8N9M7_ESCWE|nr:hypothetical protein ESCO_003365 [Escovopsis weberi]